MSKLINNTVITTHVSKIIELRKGFIINGQYYLKENMQPVPFNTVTFNDATFTDNGNSLLMLNRHINYLANHGYSMEPITDSICFDSKDDTISYVVIESNSYRFLCKFKEENNTCTLIKVNNFIGASNNLKYVGMFQTDLTINICISGCAYSSTIYSYDKQELKAVSNMKIDDMGVDGGKTYDCYSELYRDNNILLSYKSGYGHNRYTCLNIPGNIRISHDMDDVDKNFHNSSPYRNRFLYNNLYINDGNRFGVIHLGTTLPVSGKCTFTGAYLVEYDLLENNFFRTEYKLTIPEELTEKYASDSIYYAAESYCSDVWYKTIEGKKYMILYLRDGYRSSLPCRSYVFEITDNPEVEPIDDEELQSEVTKEIKLIKIQEFPLGQVGEIITFNDEPKLKFYSSRRASAADNALINNVFCYEFDEVKLEFFKTLNIHGEIKEFGFDMDRNLYILWNTNEISRYNERTVANFNAKFENALYEYAGEDINTNLIVSTTNLEGQFLEKEVVLDLKGNAIFTSNSTKTITITTSKSNEIKIPITINGAGSLSIFPKVKI